MRPDFEDMVNRSGGNISVRDAEILYETAMEISPQTLVEIGSREGGSSMVLGLAAKENYGRLFCIECDPAQKWAENIQAYSLHGHAQMVRGRSPWVVLPVSHLGDNDVIDYVFIDGDHRMRSVLVDYHYWEPLVRSGGRIAFHDWTGKNGVGEQVQRAVSIILETDDLREVIRNESTDRGIIVFEKRR